MLGREFVRTVPAGEFVNADQARQELGLRIGWVNLLASKGDLERCTTTKSGPLQASDVGVTRESVDRQVVWWRSANAAARFRRKVRLVVAAGVF